MNQILIESQYLPCLDYFFYVSKSEAVFLEYWENYQKQTYRNRCKILGVNKVDILTVPIQKTGQKVLTKDIRIDNSQSWNAIHWKAIQSAYGNAPFFEYYGEYFQQIIGVKHQFLFDLNMQLMTLCLKLLGISKELQLSDEYERQTNEKILDLRSKIHPKEDNNPFIITWTPYQQVFGSNFVNNLSIVDLLFNKGPESGTFIKNGKSNVNEHL